MTTVRADIAPENVPGAGAGLTCDAFLGDKLMLLQPERGYRAGVDAVLLAAAAPCDGAVRVLDAGAGVGTVGLCVARRCPQASVLLVERQPELAELARRNIVANGLSDRVRLAEADLANAAALTAAGVGREAFDIVLANPPYHAVGAGTPSGDHVKAGANAMPAEALDAWCRTLATTCRPGGRALLIHKAECLTELLTSLGRRFGGLDVLPIRPRRGAAAIRVIVCGTKGSRAPLRLLAGIDLHTEGHGFTPEAQAVLREGAALDVWGRR